MATKARRLAELLLMLFLVAYLDGQRLLAIPAASLPSQSAPHDWPPPRPEALYLTVRETIGVARVGEVVRSGVPLPHSLNLLTPTGLTLVDAGGTPVPASFQVLARWNAGRSATSAPIQWLLISFPATVGANGSARYQLVLDGTAGPNPAPVQAIRVTQNGTQVTVETGAATFILGGNPAALFDEVRLAQGNTRLIGGGTLSAVADGIPSDGMSTRQVRVEERGPLEAVVVVESYYGLTPVGEGQLAAVRRYTFRAGSPTALVRHAVSWEGDLCPSNGYDLTCDVDGDGQGEINGLRLTQVRDALDLDLAAPLVVQVVGAFQAPVVQGTASAGQSAWVRQRLRTARSDALVFEVSVPGGSAAGSQADGALLAASDSRGMVAIALNHMHRYEPQALRLLADGRLAVDLVDDQVWLGQRQGLFATLAVSALPPNSSRSDLDRLTWAPLNRPLHAWPEPAWFAASGAVEEFPVGTLPADLAAYDTLVPGVLELTMQQMDEKGLAGLMTFGLYPRYWGSPLYGDELDCGSDEPTPNERWDDAYWCGTWTDYHNTVVAAPSWAMRSGETEWLDELAYPAALRMLYTQINQCAPGDDWFYCGQAPAGYGGYRSDFNSSHAYFDNLMLYYWLTGDSSVVETLQRGAATMRVYLCSRRPVAPCLPTDPPADEWAQLTGRVAAQWLAVFRFVGLASDDPSYLEDWRSGLARAVTQHYVEAEQGGVHYGFWLYGGDPVDGPGTDRTDQLWMVSLYDMNNLYRLQQDTDDAPLGEPPVRPSQVLAAWARTLQRFGATTAGDGSAAGSWPNALRFTWSGARIGGSLLAVEAETGGGDPYLYNTGKSTLTALLGRAADQTGEPALQQMAEAMTRFALAAAQDDLSPLGKLQGEYLARLPAAVGHLALSDNPPILSPALYLPITRR